MTEQNSYIDMVIDHFYKDVSLRELLEAYEQWHDSLRGKNFKESEIYLKYLSHFELEPLINLPFEDKDGNSYDWDVLCRLVLASSISTYFLKMTLTEEGKQQVNICIEANYEGKKRTKWLDELSGLQILILYEVYLVEQIEFFAKANISPSAENDAAEQMDKKLAMFDILKKKALVEMELYALE